MHPGAVNARQLEGILRGMLIMNEGQDGDDVDEIDWLILATNYKEQEDGEF